MSLVTDPANAYDGSNFLALASGAILTNPPTVAGQTYTLTFTYRGPGITGMWRAENNFDDSIFGNNASTVQNVFFTNGVVGAAFSLTRKYMAPSIFQSKINPFTSSPMNCQLKAGSGLAEMAGPFFGAEMTVRD